MISAMSLGEIGDTVAVPALTAAYQSDRARLRYAAVDALAEMEDSRGDAVMQAATNDPDQGVRHRAAEALRDRDDDD